MKPILTLVFTLFFAAVTVAQRQPQPSQKNETKLFDPGSENAELIADSVIAVYALFNDKARFAQIRRTMVETGKKTVTKLDGTSEEIGYTKQVIRGESLEKERIRIDQNSPTLRYSLVYNQGEIFGILGETTFSPKAEIIVDFENEIWHSLEALFRYKEDGSKVSVAGREKYLGVELIQLDLIDRRNRKTRYFISAKTFRVMWLDYESGGVKYRRKFHDYRLSQGMLVPYRTVLWAGDRKIEEVNVLTVTFGQKVDESLFSKS
ncbi:MAG: hypothetical protein N2Z23_06575 [Pyrinomonadaceae bacterium]|nr:hypothetical protein [Pyrinomonadaceae bacterium]MCX7640087.1 hypothetical protein [Pyrinomonadaceae bacterium]MDW8304259.1 hypothetical protein [Acidobacteriota bacterium]